MHRGLQLEGARGEVTSEAISTLMSVQRSRVLERLESLVSSGRILASRAAVFYVRYSKAMREREEQR